jgi:hypothetical protein
MVVLSAIDPRGSDLFETGRFGGPFAIAADTGYLAEIARTGGQVEMVVSVPVGHRDRSDQSVDVARLGTPWAGKMAHFHFGAVAAIDFAEVTAAAKTAFVLGIEYPGGVGSSGSYSTS